MELGGGISRNGPCLDTVRALHQTVVSLRAALEQSRSEILELKDKAWPLESVENALRALSIENHVLRRKIIEKNSNFNEKEVEEKPLENVKAIAEKGEKKHIKIVSPRKIRDNFEPEIKINVQNLSPRKVSQSLENLTLLRSPRKHSNAKKLSISKTVSFSNITDCKIEQFTFCSTKMSEEKEDSNAASNNEKNADFARNNRSVENSQTELDQEQEVDDIELIFTTDDTKDSDFKEQLVSIDAGESNDETAKLLQLPVSELDQSLDVSDRELEDDVFNDNLDNDNQASSSRQTSLDMKSKSSQLCNSRSDNSINQEERSLKSYYSYQDSSFENKSIEKDESFDRFEERIRIVETDISKVGIQDVEYTAGRRNTCPNPLQYRPILHRYLLLLLLFKLLYRKTEL